MTSREQTELIFWDSKFRDATIQADHQLGKHPDRGLINILQSRKMNGDLCIEFA